MARQHFLADTREPADDARGVIEGIERGPQVGMWLDSEQARRYVGRPTLKAWYGWRDRRGIPVCGDGTVSRRDLDRALKTPRKRHRMSPVSLANLQRKGR